jgi:hypothetical protein
VKTLIEDKLVNWLFPIWVREEQEANLDHERFSEKWKTLDDATRAQIKALINP